MIVQRASDLMNASRSSRSFIRSQCLVIFADRFSVTLRHRIAVDGVQRIRLLASIQLLTQPRARVLQRGHNPHFNEIPLRRFPLLLIFTANRFRARTCSGQLLTQLWLFHQFFDGAKPFRPLAKTASRQRTTRGFSGATCFAELARELFKAFSVASTAAR
jgi:hypothetical protein